MMRLYSSPASPFVRKVMMTILLKGLTDRIELVAADTRVPRNDVLAAANPLSKIPALVLEDGTQIFDSKVICEYLDGLTSEPALLPPAGTLDRIRCLTRGALADGVMEAVVLQVYEERYRPADKHVASWLARQQVKVDGGLDAAERAAKPFAGNPDYGDITLACALGYIDLRKGPAWRESRPRLTAWFAEFDGAVPAFGETRPA